MADGALMLRSGRRERSPTSGRPESKGKRENAKGKSEDPRHLLAGVERQKASWKREAAGDDVGRPGEGRGGLRRGADPHPPLRGTFSRREKVRTLSCGGGW